jgi:uncharacterized protein (DUF433 family)
VRVFSQPAAELKRVWDGRAGVSVAEIAEQFEIPAEQVEAVLDYAKSYGLAHRL